MLLFHYRLGPLILCAFWATSGCQSLRNGGQKYETIQAAPHHNIELARKKNTSGLKHIHTDKLDLAERDLQEALIADVDFGPAHNNLGYVYFLQNKFYLAAWEFEYAHKLMPESGEPLNNLGLVYEAVTRLSEAQSYFEQAHTLEPENAEYLGNLTRLRLARGECSEETADLLRGVALKDDRPEWREWALEQLHTSHVQLNSDLTDSRVSIPPKQSQASGRASIDAQPPAAPPSLEELPHQVPTEKLPPQVSEEPLQVPVFPDLIPQKPTSEPGLSVPPPAAAPNSN